MKLLLDTHDLLWWLSDDARLGPKVRDLVADPGNDVLISTASLWEIVIKVRIGKLNAEIAAVMRAIEQDGFMQLDIAPAHLRALRDRPLHPDHRDPFDHLLIAQAISERATLVSDDRNVRRYVVEAMSCAD